MNTVCRVCLRDVSAGTDYHPRCVRDLFGARRPPTLDIELSKLHTAALAMVGHTSLSGVQKKISVNLSADRETLQVAAEGGRYLLKPQTETYPALPENEHITTLLARLVGIETGRFGLVSLKDGSLAYVVARFDRLTPGRKIGQEDFCQLAEKSPKEKYDGSAELCVRLLRKYASEPLIEILKFYRQLVFAWWSGNGDMHLKNFSLHADEDGRQKLTPAYDQVCTRLVIQDDPLALPVQGKKDHLSKDTWLQFAAYCQLPPRAAARVLKEQAEALQAALELIDRCFLPQEMKDGLKHLIRQRTETLLGSP